MAEQDRSQVLTFSLRPVSYKTIPLLCSLESPILIGSGVFGWFTNREQFTAIVEGCIFSVIGPSSI